MDTVLRAVRAAGLLGRWTLIAERHAGGCSCCPGLGDIGMDEVEARVAAWLRERHEILASGASVTALLRDCVALRCDAPAEALRELFDDFAEALDDLERIQAGLA